MFYPWCGDPVTGRAYLFHPWRGDPVAGRTCLFHPHCFAPLSGGQIDVPSAVGVPHGRADLFSSYRDGAIRADMGPYLCPEVEKVK